MCSDYIAHLDGVTVIKGGWLNHHWAQMGYQLADSLSGFAYSFGGSCIILFALNLIPGCSLRASEESEVLGMDDAEIGEFAVSPPLSPILPGSSTYRRPQYDYVELTRDVVNGQLMEDNESKYSADRGSPMNLTEKVFAHSSTPDDEDIKAHASD